MIQIELNGESLQWTPSPGDALGEGLRDALPQGHVISSLRVDGVDTEPAELDARGVSGVRRIQVRSARPQDLASQALSETIEWMDRIASALREVSREYRLGAEGRARARLPDVIDSLHVLASLLDGIGAHLPMDADRRAVLEPRWKDAEASLHKAVGGFESDLASGDPVRIGDRTGHFLPAALERFQGLLREMRG
ncbi:MAG: hypothetical protein ACE5IL_00135 [Myxococcota bacterium]